MQSRTPVEIADVYSRKRAIVFAAAAVVFLLIQVVARPFFAAGAATANLLTPGVMWAINVIFLLLCLATGGGILNRSEIRALVNDEVSDRNYKTSAIAGFWVAMATAIGLYFLPIAESFTARGVVYIIVTPSVAVAVLVFSYLELRAHRDA
ncbi:MAG TPA: hypothetical protein VII02_04120 [Gemmatimonadaceae bacterium]